MWTLQAIRRIRSLRRKIFGKRAPHWAKDGLSLIKYVNLLRLVPTVHMIICKPAHFFKSVPAILSGRKNYYLSPLQFVTNLAVLQIIVVQMLFPDNPALNKEAVVLWNIGVAILSPVLIACASALVLSLWFICAHIWPLSAVAHEMPFNYHGALNPLSPATYTNLAWGRYFWSLFYYYLYFYFMLLVVAMCLVAFEVGIWMFYASISRTIHINKLTIIPFAFIGLIAAILGYWLFVRPYIFLLWSSARGITRRMWLYVENEDPQLSKWLVRDLARRLG